MTEKTKEICNLLNNMGINFKLIKHKAVYTIDEMAELKERICSRPLSFASFIL